MPSNLTEIRTAVLARMVSQASGRSLGRTQVMKLFFFLQELKGIELGYDFTLFTYGPFDSEVLSDLSTACSLGCVTEELVLYARSYGYDIQPGPQADRISTQLEQQNPELVEVIDETVQEFGTFGAGELELRSTILFVDREFSSEGRTANPGLLVDRVQQIKPHFERHIIADRVSQMRHRGYLRSLSS